MLYKDLGAATDSCRFTAHTLIQALLLVVELNDLNSRLNGFIALFLLFNALKISRLYHHLPLLFLFLISFIALVFKEFEEWLLGRLRAIVFWPENNVLIFGEDLGIIHWVEFLFLLLGVLIFCSR